MEHTTPKAMGNNVFIEILDVPVSQSIEVVTEYKSLVRPKHGRVLSAGKKCTTVKEGDIVMLPITHGTLKACNWEGKGDRKIVVVNENLIPAILEMEDESPDQLMLG